MRISRRTALVVLAAALLAAAGWVLGGRTLVSSFRTRLALERLAEVAGERLPEARFNALSATRSARASAGATRGRGGMTLVKARAGAVLAASESLLDADGRGATAIAQLMIGDLSPAVQTLEAAVGEYPDDAHLWSDLAAALHARSSARVDGAEGFLSALVAADRSRSIDPRNANALFNRALILERLGLRTLAADAWRAYIDVEEDPSRDADAMRRLQSMEGESWKREQPRLERAAIAGQSATVEAIVSRYPQDARAYGDYVYLTSWANALVSGDSATAANQLTIARAMGAVLRQRGEALLSDAVATIDSVADERALRSLAMAQQDYARCRDEYFDSRNAEAVRFCNAAAQRFEQEQSPMALVARAFAASAMHDHNATTATREALAAVAAKVRAHPRYRGLLGLIQWPYGRAELLAGHWDEALAALSEARAIFVELGETKNAGAVEEILAETYELLGRTDLAWQYCLASFRGVSESANAYRLQVALAGGVRIAMRSKSWDLAASLLDLELAVAADGRNPRLTADALRRLYVVQHERKDFEARDIALARARIVAPRAGDEAARQIAELDEAEAVAAMHDDPRRAVHLLTGALHLAAASDQRLFVAELLRNRGRAHRVAGDVQAAAADFQAGVEELERQRGGIATGELRARFFDTAETLFADAIALEVDRGDAAAAFAYADRARARALIDSSDAVAVPRPADVPAILAQRLPDTALVEFAVLDREVVTFCILDGDVTMHRSPVTKAELRTLIDRLHQAMDAGQPERMQTTASALYELLFGGVSANIAASQSLIVVPDGDLQRIPFGVLWRASARQYLVQSHAIAMAPSAGLLASRNMPARSAESILLVGNAAGNEEQSLGYLASVNEEIASLRRVYPSSRVLIGAEASVARFTSEASSYDAIHFAGHGLSDDQSFTASLLFASGRMYMSDIAKLRLPRAPLVVLAACGTLRGRTAGVEGMPSLARSFLAAGASTVIGTVTDVDDATAAALLGSFHRSIASGTGPAAALRNAQLDAIARGGAAAEPKNWAPYVVYTAAP